MKNNCLIVDRPSNKQENIRVEYCEIIRTTRDKIHEGILFEPYTNRFARLSSLCGKFPADISKEQQIHQI